MYIYVKLGEKNINLSWDQGCQQMKKILAATVHNFYFKAAAAIRCSASQKNHAVYTIRSPQLRKPLLEIHTINIYLKSFNIQ